MSGHTAITGVRGHVNVSDALEALTGSEHELPFYTQPRNHMARTVFTGNVHLTFSHVFHPWAFVP